MVGSLITRGHKLLTLAEHASTPQPEHNLKRRALSLNGGLSKHVEHLGLRTSKHRRIPATPNEALRSRVCRGFNEQRALASFKGFPSMAWHPPKAYT